MRNYCASLRSIRTLMLLGATALAVVALTALSAGWAKAQNLPRLGEDGLMPLSDELHIGEDVARSLYSEPDYIDDPQLSEYIDSIFQRLVDAGRSSGAIDPAMGRFVWRVLAGADTTVNAFSVPGGVFGLHLATLGMTDTPGEMASVLAHEISHVTQRHIARMEAKQKQFLPVTIGSMILGAIVASKNSDVSSAVFMGGQGLAAQKQLSFSRDAEREADRMGMQLLQYAGYRPAAFVEMFEKLQNANRLNGDDSYPYLRTHPLTTERIADMRSRLPAGTSLALPAPDLRHLFMAARARALATDRVDSWHTMVEQAQAALSQANTSKAPPQAANASAPQIQAAWSQAQGLALLYQGSVAALRLHDAPAAQRLAAALRQRVAAKAGLENGRQGQMQIQRILNLLDADIAREQGRWAEVQRLTSASGDLYRPELLLHAQASIRLGQADAAREQLQGWVTEHASDASAWLLLAQAQDRLGHGAQMARAQGEAAIAQFDYAKGLVYLKSARNALGADLFEGSILDARIRQVQQEQKTMDEKLTGD